MVMALEVNPIVIVVSGDGNVDNNKIIVNSQPQRIIDDEQWWGRNTTTTTTTIINNNINARSNSTRSNNSINTGSNNQNSNNNKKNNNTSSYKAHNADVNNTNTVNGREFNNCESNVHNNGESNMTTSCHSNSYHSNSHHSNNHHGNSHYGNSHHGNSHHGKNHHSNSHLSNSHHSSNHEIHKNTKNTNTTASSNNHEIHKNTKNTYTTTNSSNHHRGDKTEDDLNLIQLDSLSTNLPSALHQTNGSSSNIHSNGNLGHSSNLSNGNRGQNSSCGDRGSRNHLNVPSNGLRRGDGFCSEESLLAGQPSLSVSMCSFESSEFSCTSPHCQSSNSFDGSNCDVDFSIPPLTRARSQPLQPEPIEDGAGFRTGGGKGGDEETSRSPHSRSTNLFPPTKSLRNFVKRTNSARKSQQSSLSAPAVTRSTSNSSNFSIRRTFSNSFRGIAKENFHISFPTKNKKKPRQRYRIVEAKTGQQDGLSFEVVGKQGFYLRVKASVLMPDKDNSDTHFNKDCTYVPLPDMWFPSFFAFESVSKPSYFIRLTTHGDLVLEKYDGTSDFKQEASFKLTRKPCASCLQVGSRTWAKKKSGEYCRGRVVSMEKNRIEVQFDNHKRDTHWITDVKDLVPDIIPRPDDITVGTRVIAQWVNKYKLTPVSLSASRQKLYPGVVSSVKSGDSYEVLFDDGEISRDKKAIQIRLMRSYYFHDHEHAANEATTAPTETPTTPRGNEDMSPAPTRDDSDRNIRRCSVSDVSLDDKHNEKVSVAFAKQRTDPAVEENGCSSKCKGGGGSEMGNKQNQSKPNTNHFLGTISNDNRLSLSPSPWETCSQDSGYHGCSKRPNGAIKKSADQSSSKSVIRNGYAASHDFCDSRIPDERIEQRMVRSKSLEDLCDISRYKSRRKRRSLPLTKS